MYCVISSEMREAHTDSTENRFTRCHDNPESMMGKFESLLTLSHLHKERSDQCVLNWAGGLRSLSFSLLCSTLFPRETEKVTERRREQQRREGKAESAGNVPSGIMPKALFVVGLLEILTATTSSNAMSTSPATTLSTLPSLPW